MEKDKLITYPDGCLTPGETGRLTVGRKITLTLELISQEVAASEARDSSGTQRKRNVRPLEPVTRRLMKTQLTRKT
jgi:hypothetical protein